MLICIGIHFGCLEKHIMYTCVRLLFMWWDSYHHGLTDWHFFSVMANGNFLSSFFKFVLVSCSVISFHPFTSYFYISLFWIKFFLSFLAIYWLFGLVMSRSVSLLFHYKCFLTPEWQAQMRDLDGFVETRRKLLTLKPTVRINWIGFAVAQHLNSKYV